MSIHVLLPLPFNKTYAYQASDDALPPLQGQIVQVPFGKQTLYGVIWPSSDHHEKKTYDLRPLGTLFSEVLPSSSCQFLLRVSQYTLAPLGSLLKMIFGSCAQDVFKKKISPLEITVQNIDSPPPPRTRALSPEQQMATQKISPLIQQQAFSTILLEGLTGSGKTEVYFESVAKVLSAGKQVLILLPEIALTSQFVRRFQERFGFSPHLWHADITPQKRRMAWTAAYTGEARVVVGARSALFLPYPRLGLIIVDEEHDSSYKQEEGTVRYHARDMAVLRASIEKIPIILVSATPSLESLWNVAQKRYKHVKLKKRFQATLPRLSLIPIGKVFQSDLWISPLLREKLIETKAKEEQSLLFLNRRGYAPFVCCKNCGHLATCPDCHISFVYHKRTQGLLCHYCGKSQPASSPCVSCEISDSTLFKGPGVEKLKEEVFSFLPQARVEVMSSDHVSSPKKLEVLMTALERKDIDLLIGTQMVAKGHHFPSLTCVGIIDGDAGTQNLDFRAQEKMLQLLTQVSGRAGRAESPGAVYIQTQEVNHPLLQALVTQTHDTWLEQEMENRSAHFWPPWGRLAALIISSSCAKQGQAYAMELARSRPSSDSIRILGPIPAPLFVLRRQYRWRFLIRGPRDSFLQPFIQKWLQATSPPSQVRLIVDIDPYQFM